MSTEEKPTQEKKEKETKKDKKAERQKERELQRLKELADLNVQVSFEDVENDKVVYGHLPLIQSTFQKSVKYTQIGDINKDLKDQQVVIRCRVHNTRSKGKGAFIVLRDGCFTIQGLHFKSETSPEKMVKYIGNLTKESIVEITGTIVVPDEEIRSNLITQKDVEIHISKIFCVVAAIAPLPLQVEDCMIPEDDDEEEVVNKQEEEKKKPSTVGQEIKLDYRVIDMRAPANLAIFKIESAIQYYFREFLFKDGFHEIHTPKLIGTASEGGANVFEVKYFKTKAYLAQSPQLYKQMAVQGDLMKVFEIGPVFRAENSQTHRHLTEFVGLDMEMRFNYHYSEVLDVIDQLFIHIFTGIEENYKNEIEIISQQYKISPLKYNKKNNLRITYAEGMKLLRESGEKISDLDDISTTQEKLLGKIIKEKYDTDFYFMDKFPLSVRPFYTMPDPKDENLSNSYDFFIRGEEISSGAQRIHDSDLLLKRAKELNVDVSPIQAYVDCFKYGAYPHAGCGVGLERVVMLYLGIKNVRKTSMFPRDPKRLSP
eukprot:gene2427-3138_t